MPDRDATRLALLAALLCATPALARDPEKPVTDRAVGVEDVATTPLRDLNLQKRRIPQILLDAQADPYGLGGMRRCPQIAAAIGELDAVLGEDFDLFLDTRGKGPSAGRMAQSVVGSFMPFRGIVREITGANEQDRRLQTAIRAGMARRAFLKGTGQARGCRYPARPAQARDIAAFQAAHPELAKAASEQDDSAAEPPR